MNEEQEIVSGQEFSLKINPETCCDLCNEIINNYIDCPVCKKYSQTVMRCDLEDKWNDEDEGEKTIQCENCNTLFEKTSDMWYYECKVKVIELGSLDPQKYPKTIDNGSC